jgi:hypothetical protein
MCVYIGLNLKKLILSEGDELGNNLFLLAHEEGENESSDMPDIDYQDT